jgi:lysophospholipase L1-like esterase
MSLSAQVRAQDRSMNHVVLLGDSVFDNRRYVPGQPDVVNQVRERLPQGWGATLQAVDGDVVADIGEQVSRMPAGASHLVLSVGGNDALRASSIFQQPSRTVGESLVALAQIQERFRATYEAMIAAVLARGLPTAICTIYDPRFPDPVQRRAATAALALINDAIIRVAVAHGLTVIDLRAVCSDDADFANAIEPSSAGGWKIAGAIVSAVTGPSDAAPRAQILKS